MPKSIINQVAQLLAEQLLLNADLFTNSPRQMWYDGNGGINMKNQNDKNETLKNEIISLLMFEEQRGVLEFIKGLLENGEKKTPNC